MMHKTQECTVKLWGEDVGVLAQIKNKTYFQYDGAFLDKGLEISPLHLPLSKKVYETTHLDYFEGLAGVFADALPDSWGIKMVENYFLKHKNTSPYEISAIDKVLYMGSRAAGALEFYPSYVQSDNQKQTVEIAQLVKESKRVLRGDISYVLPEIFRISSDSLGGAKAKATVGLSNDTNEMISTQEQLPDGFEHWLIKFDGTEEGGSASENLLAEKVYLDMAKKCGIDTVESKIIQDGSLSHLAVKRFDRKGNDKPLHMHTLAGMAHINFKDKDMMSYDKFFRATLAVTKSYAELEESYRRMVFNALSGNQDDHAKNHTFVMDKKGEWRLSPAYDITLTFGYGHQMDINLKDKGVNHDDLLIMAERFDLTNAKEILEEQINVLHDFRKYGKDVGLSEVKMQSVSKHFKLSV
jgi:serine/threonine-protein kinase HipA